MKVLVIRVLLAVLLVSGCASVEQKQASIDADRVLIIGASVSSGFSGKPSGQYVAEWLALPYRNEASVASRLYNYIDDIVVEPRTLVVAIDASYWDSYATTCDDSVSAVNKLFKKTAGSYLVTATVPDRRAGFWEVPAMAWSFRQQCRAEINKALIAGCGKNCVLLDADAVYKGRENEDIHLDHETWRVTAEKIMQGLKIIQALK